MKLMLTQLSTKLGLKLKLKLSLAEIVVHYHCASQPPERRSTGTPTTRANFIVIVIDRG